MNNEELNNTINAAVLDRYKSGFKVAINFLYHRHNKEDQDAFREFLNKNIGDPLIVEEAIQMKSTMGEISCPAGQCDLGNGCEPCTFAIAFDGSYIS